MNINSNEYLNEPAIRRFINNTCSRQNTPDFKERKTDIWFSDAYGQPEERVAFFCVTGTPHRYFGYVRVELENDELVYVGQTSHGKIKVCVEDNT